MGGELDIAVRAYTPPTTPPSPVATGTTDPPSSTGRFPEHVLIFDTETTIDAAQALNFGAWRYCRVTHADGGVALRCVQEGLFYADDLPQRDPEALAVLREYARTHRGDVDLGDLDASTTLVFQSQSEFLERIFFRVAFRLRGAVVAFNFPFDLSRVAWQAGMTRNRRPDRRDAFEGGFSFAVFSYVRDGERHESRHRPRVAIKSIDSKRALKGFRSPEKIDSDDLIPDDGDGRPEPRYRFRGHLLDLRTLVFALTDRSHSLESACDAFDVPYTKRDVVHGQITRDYITYCREDVAASQQLTQASVTEFLSHPIELQATRAYSPATIGKGYLKEMGIRPPRERQHFDPKLMGWCMSAYYGGRAECRIRRTPVPVVYCDFKSMYPTVCALMGISDLLTADFDVTDATAEVQALLNTITADHCFDPATWPGLVAFAQILPDDDVLPVRARYGPSPTFGIGVNHLTSTEPLWFAIPDLIASTLLTGKPPTILRAVRFTAGTKSPGLLPVSLLGDTLVDPVGQDFFATVVEQRTVAKNAGDENRSKGLKTLANATSYGIYAQMTRRELGDRKEQITIYGCRDEPFERQIGAPEEPGEYAFPPFAAAITAAARLLLALTEHEVTARGGTYAFCDTDSMAIVATETGGLVTCNGGPHQFEDETPAIRALSWQQVEDIRARFEALNPYNPDIVPGSILELEAENYNNDGGRQQLHCFAISAKRYTFYLGGSDGPRLVKPSQHGLGHLLNPADPASEDRDWIGQTWNWILRSHCGLAVAEPDWLDRPAVGRLSVSSPHLHRLMTAQNQDRPYARQIKPFGFLNIAFVHPLERPANEQHMVLIAPFSTRPADWLQQAWTNRYSAAEYAITLEPSDGMERDGVLTAKSYRDMLAEYAKHPEHKSADQDGQRCGRRTTGLLQRRHVVMSTITHIGKEANALDDTTAGLLQRVGEAQSAYDDTELMRFQRVVLPELRDLGVREVARRTGHSVGAVHAVLAGKATPRAEARSRYERAARPEFN